MTKFQFYAFLLCYCLFMAVCMIVIGYAKEQYETMTGGLYVLLGLSGLEGFRQFVFYLTREKL